VLPGVRAGGVESVRVCGILRAVARVDDDERESAVN
jgi:hypothetical protein